MGMVVDELIPMAASNVGWEPHLRRSGQWASPWEATGAILLGGSPEPHFCL